MEKIRWRGRGEYGPCAYDYHEVPVFYATDREAARKHVIKWLKAQGLWERVGEHNVYVEEFRCS